MVNTIKLRKMIGWLGLLLPWLCVVLTKSFPDSISITYYTQEAGPVFMIILGAASMLLICYQGYDYWDNLLNTIAGIFGLGICLFPCANPAETVVGTFQLPQHMSGFFHNASAILFFGLLSYNSLFQFTKTAAEQPSKQKTCRNRIFRICGVGMIASFLIIAILSLFKVNNAIWIGELLALNFFGISWLTKANCYKWLFAD